jgi:hypothetical protein
MLYDPFTNKKLRNKPIMKAEDMFAEKMVQVFSRKTGEYLGYVYLGEDPENLQEIIENAPPGPDEIQINPNQLNLFP